MSMFSQKAVAAAAVGLSLSATASFAADPNSWSGRHLVQLAQSNAPAPPAEQKRALSTGTQVNGQIKSIDQGARTITMQENQVFTIPRTIDIAAFKVGDNVLVSYESDTMTALSVEPSRRLP